MKVVAHTAVTVSLLALTGAQPVQASSKEKVTPAGTLLLPLTPKIDDGTTAMPQLSRRAASAKPVILPAPSAVPVPEKEPARGTAAPATISDTELRELPDQISAESGALDEALLEGIDENTTLRGTVQIVADDTEYDQEKNTFLGTGNAVAIIGGQDARLEADTILFDQNSDTIDARGNVKILRDGQLTTGSSFKFKIHSDEYLITDPDTEINGTQVIARLGRGTRSGLAFRDGTISMPEPIYIRRNEQSGTLSYLEESVEKALHPEAYVPAKQSFKFKARRMTYERYKDQGNLTVQGGRLMFGNFGVPLPRFTATVGQENSGVTFPVVPVISNNLQSGGINIGPKFNYAIGKEGVFSWSPLVQIGGRRIDGGVVENERSQIGAGFLLGYRTPRLQTHVAYGSVSNLLVADLIYRFRENLEFQSGINRFLPDGLFGMRRPRLLGELVHTKNIGKIPFLSILQFRSAAGWAQDQPVLLALTPRFGELFTDDTSTVKTSAFRLQEQVTINTQPIFALGNDSIGAKLSIFGGVAAKAYSTGDFLLMGQIGPMLNISLNRVRLQAGYAQSGVAGQSPFVFDQFIQGQRSTILGGDVKISRFLSLGGNLGYNLNDKLLFQRSISAAIGPDDFKVILSRDTISGINRFGFDVLYGAPIPFNKLILKGAPDYGQLGGI